MPEAAHRAYLPFHHRSRPILPTLFTTLSLRPWKCCNLVVRDPTGSSWVALSIAIAAEWIASLITLFPLWVYSDPIDAQQTRQSFCFGLAPTVFTGYQLVLIGYDHGINPQHCYP